MVHTYIQDEKSNIVKKYGVQSSVVVAKQDIQSLELIDDSKVQIISVPQNFLASGHFKTVQEIENTVAAVPILKGEQITKPRVIYPGNKTGLARQVSVGKRAVSIAINESQAVGKLIKPGDRIDLIAPVDYSAGRPDLRKVKTVLQDVLVLSTGMSMTNSIPLYGVKTPRVIKKMNLSTYSDYRTVTLELTPYQVQKLFYILAYSNAGGSNLYLSLRNNNDKKQVRIKGTNIYDLIEEDSAKAKKFFHDKYLKK
jgi:pilus assembly protein CpaB